MYTETFQLLELRISCTTVNEEHIFSSLMPVQDFELQGQQFPEVQVLEFW